MSVFVHVISAIKKNQENLYAIFFQSDASQALFRLDYISKLHQIFRTCKETSEIV